AARPHAVAAHVSRAAGAHASLPGPSDARGGAKAVVQRADSEERHPRRHDEVQRPDTRSGRRRRGARGADLTMGATGPTTRQEIHTDGRPRDRSADPTTTAAVSRRAVGRGQAGALALQRLVGNRATGRLLRGAQAAIRTGARGLARLGYPLGKALPPG